MMQQSACASCDAAGLCHSHESKMRTLVVNVPDGSAFKEGDQLWPPCWCWLSILRGSMPCVDVFRASLR